MKKLHSWMKEKKNKLKSKRPLGARTSQQPHSSNDEEHTEDAIMLKGIAKPTLDLETKLDSRPEHQLSKIEPASTLGTHIEVSKPDPAFIIIKTPLEGIACANEPIIHITSAGVYSPSQNSIQKLAVNQLSVKPSKIDKSEKKRNTYNSDSFSSYYSTYGAAYSSRTEGGKTCGMCLGYLSYSTDSTEMCRCRSP